MADETVVYALPNRSTPGSPVCSTPRSATAATAASRSASKTCSFPIRDKGKPPLILHPEECWYCGPCVDDCPLPGAIRLNHPLQQRVRWKRKDSGGHSGYRGTIMSIAHESGQLLRWPYTVRYGSRAQLRLPTCW